MGIKVVLESLDDVPEAQKELYQEDNGKFVLALEGIDDHPKVRGLVTANRENVKKRDSYKKQVDDLTAKIKEFPEDFDAEEYLALKAQAGDPNDPEVKKKRDEHMQSQRQLYEGRIKTIQDQFATQLAAKDAELAERDGYIDQTLVVSGLRDSLTEAGVEPDLLDGALASLRQSVKVQRSDNGDRKAVVETDLGDVEVAAFVKDWAGSKGKPYLRKTTGPDPRGNNGRGSFGAKTIARKEWDGMSHLDRSTKAKEGFRVVD